MQSQIEFLKRFLNPEDLGSTINEFGRDEIRQRLGMPRVLDAGKLRWEFDSQGEWTAFSLAQDGGVPFQYRIQVCDDGTFWVVRSDSELVGEHPPECFPSLCKAQEWCSGNEIALIPCVET